MLSKPPTLAKLPRLAKKHKLAKQRRLAKQRGLAKLPPMRRRGWRFAIDGKPLNTRYRGNDFEVLCYCNGHTAWCFWIPVRYSTGCQSRNRKSAIEIGGPSYCFREGKRMEPEGGGGRSVADVPILNWCLSRASPRFD